MVLWARFPRCGGSIRYFMLTTPNIDRLYDCWLNVDAPNRLPNDPAQLGNDVYFRRLRREHSATRRGAACSLRRSLATHTTSGGGLPHRIADRGHDDRRGAAAEALAGRGTLPGSPVRRPPLPLAVREGAGGRGLGAAAAGTKPYLTIEGVQYDKAPGRSLRRLSSRRRRSPASMSGVINFFNLVPCGLRRARRLNRGSRPRPARTSGSTLQTPSGRLNLSSDAQPSLVFRGRRTALAGSTAEAIAPADERRGKRPVRKARAL